jgi:hypothetical protein|tara:strand:+ start:365 stop:505 length:141 start_codon:yes stop_codon:yes gene_type:complete
MQEVIDIFNILISLYTTSPIEIKMIILAVAVAFPLSIYFGMKGTGL